jgi:membrane dipeptidase
VPCDLLGAQAVQAVFEQIEAVYGWVARYPQTLALARSADEVEQAWRDGRIASLLGAEGGHCINDSLAVLRSLYRLGVRYLTLTHMENTSWADSATDVPRHNGLTDFGRQVVAECNRLGMLVDLSHTAPATMHAALDVSTAPAFFSHSCARALVDHPRNVPDDVLVRVRDTGGIVMATFVPAFLTAQGSAWFDRYDAMHQQAAHEPETARTVEKQWMAENPPPRVTAADVADHIEHIREVAGIEHVGIGGDFDGITVLPEGLGGVECYPALLDELSRRSWSDGDMEKVAWQNALRVLRDTEAAAAS